MIYKFSFLLISCMSVSIHQIQAQAITADSLYKAGNWKQAIDEYRHYLDIVPTDKPGMQWNKIGQCYFNLQDWNNAIDAFKRSVAYNGSSNIMYSIGCAYAKSEQQDSALAWLDRSVNSGFNQYANMEADEDLYKLKEDNRFKDIVNKIKKNAMPCSFQPESHQFDFWIGHWDVFNLQGQLSGNSVIEQILGECVIFESWTDFFGNKGKSFNFYNSSDKKWQQTWVDDKGSVTEFINGSYEDGVMRFATSRPTTDLSTGAKVYRRLTFFKVNPNEVRQLGERSDDSEKNWQTAYDLKYIRK